MMKNTEWGAVAYLHHSVYGSRQSLRVNNNSSSLTGYAGVSEPTCGLNAGVTTSSSCNTFGTSSSVTLPYNTTIGYLASTTANITGIYDMSGGTWEYVMGYDSTSTTIGGNSGLTAIYGDFFTNDYWKRYYDEYNGNTYFGFNNRILGDATGEMGPYASFKDGDGENRYRGSWYGDQSKFLNKDVCWFSRGGHYNGGIVSGIFSFLHQDATGNHWHTFRIVLTPQ